MAEPHYADELVTLYLGDCREVMAAMEAASIDAVVCDPPYELGFMGRAWDTSGIAYDVNVWRECLRLLKPGGHLLAFGGTRTYHRLACAVEDAGFEIRDSLHWIYGSGFPKGKACLKPSHEPIVMARKPDRKSAPLPGLDDCRIAGQWTTWRRSDGTISPKEGHSSPLPMNRDAERAEEVARNPEHPAGRWPPNVLLTHSAECNGVCAPDCPVAELDRQAPAAGSFLPSGREYKAGLSADVYGGRTEHTTTALDAPGGASRFFPVFRYQAKASSKERPRLPDGTAWPAVKPVDLMRWLVRLVTPPGGLVLDPFAGTGTTGQACALEGFRCILAERDPVAAELAVQRLGRPSQRSLDADTDVPLFA